jgi:hypothetical protein
LLFVATALDAVEGTLPARDVAVDVAFDVAFDVVLLPAVDLTLSRCLFGAFHIKTIPR